MLKLFHSTVHISSKRYERVNDIELFVLLDPPLKRTYKNAKYAEAMQILSYEFKNLWVFNIVSFLKIIL